MAAEPASEDLSRAEAGDVAAMFRLARQLSEADPVEARTWYTKAAELGDVDSMFNLGCLLVEGDRAGARQWWTQAAEASDEDAMVNLATLLRGSDRAESLRWQKRAAEAGSAEAMRALGDQLVDLDPKAAQRWLERAADAGNAKAMVALGELLDPYDLWPLVKGPRQRMAQQWFEKAAEAGCSLADYKLGYRMIQRDLAGVWSDPAILQQARWRLERAAEGGSMAAMSILGGLLRMSDPATSLHYFSQAAEQGHGGSALDIAVTVGPAAARREHLEQAMTMGLRWPDRLFMWLFRPFVRLLERREAKGKPPLADSQVPTRLRGRTLFRAVGWTGWAIRLVGRFATRQYHRLGRPLRCRRAHWSSSHREGDECQAAAT